MDFNLQWEEEIFLPDIEQITLDEHGAYLVVPNGKFELKNFTKTKKRALLSEAAGGESSESKQDWSAVIYTPPEDGLTVLDILPWDDVVVTRILPYLSTKDLFALRQVSVGFRDIVSIFFAKSHHLDLTDIGSSFTNEAFQVMTSNATNLVTLKIPSCKKWIQDKHILPLIESNPNLEVIDISENSSLSTEVVRTISVSCRQLRTLKIAECQQVSSTSVESVAMNCDKLERLDLTGCWDMDDDTVNLILQLHPHLKWLSVARAYGITDLTITGVCMFCPSIEHLDIQGCWRITDDAVRKLWNMENLKTLNVKECRYITERSLARLRARGIQLDILLPEESDLAKLERHLRAREFARVRSVPPNFVL